MHIKIMKRVKDEKRGPHARAIFSYTSDFVPRVGELVDFKMDIVQLKPPAGGKEGDIGGYIVRQPPGSFRRFPGFPNLLERIQKQDFSPISSAVPSTPIPSETVTAGL